MEMSQKQKEQQALNRQPPSGPDGELQFQQEIQKLANEDSQGEKMKLIVCNSTFGLTLLDII